MHQGAMAAAIAILARAWWFAGEVQGRRDVMPNDSNYMTNDFFRATGSVSKNVAFVGTKEPAAAG
jgi:hypothetical protein